MYEYVVRYVMFDVPYSEYVSYLSVTYKGEKILHHTLQSLKNTYAVYISKECFFNKDMNKDQSGIE